MVHVTPVTAATVTATPATASQQIIRVGRRTSYAPVMRQLSTSYAPATDNYCRMLRQGQPTLMADWSADMGSGCAVVKADLSDVSDGPSTASGPPVLPSPPPDSRKSWTRAQRRQRSMVRLRLRKMPNGAEHASQVSADKAMVTISTGHSASNNTTQCWAIRSTIAFNVICPPERIHAGQSRRETLFLRTSIGRLCPTPPDSYRVFSAIFGTLCRTFSIVPCRSWRM